MIKMLLLPCWSSELTVPNGGQRGDTPHHGVLREKETHPRERELLSDLSHKDSRTSARSAPGVSSPSSPVIPSKSFTSLANIEDKENKPKLKDLSVSRVPPALREDIPQFFFPLGKPQAPLDLDGLMQRVAAEFSSFEGGKAYKEQMGRLTKVCGFPLYWKILLYRAAGGDKQGFVTLQTFSAMLKKLLSSCHDEASRFLRLMAKPGRSTLDFDDFLPLVQDVVDCHPGLSFLQDAPEFHSRYIHTVISRIFFCVNRSWTGRITLPELRKSNFLQVLSILEEEEDINQVTEYFSYEHFYVIYCKFWELDKDHDLFIDRADLARHNDHVLNSRIIDRIFSGAVTRGKDFQEGRMSYKEFVWFLISEEDKKHPTSIEYWFRCMDLDGDGVISMYEMEYFYQEQMQKMEALGIEKLPFEDCLCQMFDLVRPREAETITLGDLKNCRMANIFFDTFFNLDKFLEHEQRDPFANARDLDAAGNEVSDWDRYAAEEYDILVAEEGVNEHEEIFSQTFTRSHYEDDFEPDDDEAVQEELARLTDPPQRKVTPRLHPVSNDDMYDFSGNSLGF
ncbi:serine/threonine-protein phosphatase 2A regulatory subunit B'' subunit beta-like isoform X5 [Pomacea canaliculata]|uniref:serine/threonine-protein phosphatase 2A regulatory subunit B'' subunit beta-like isoform X5 n=1 Tax=Pomacea canaliculata TaxID=400727 RepID=UPI000D73752D|nr:serine/threonine-protein phosphatase 2A regulatory subunit B'' subunit beta-like isoform X5 [Pomacea canaliculata]